MGPQEVWPTHLVKGVPVVASDKSLARLPKKTFFIIRIMKLYKKYNYCECVEFGGKCSRKELFARVF